MTLKEIRAALRRSATAEACASFAKFVPSAQKIYGVRVPVLNKIAKQSAGGGLPLVRALWTSQAFEERLLAAKILGAICKKDPDTALKFIGAAARDITDWPVCDTLATQGVRAIAQAKHDEIF